MHRRQGSAAVWFISRVCCSPLLPSPSFLPPCLPPSPVLPQDVLGHMLEFSLDQLGSRFIQQKLDTLTPEELEAAFAEIAPKAQMLMNDVFGNYVIQKFLELDVDTHRQDLAQQMKGSVGGGLRLGEGVAWHCHCLAALLCDAAKLAECSPATCSGCSAR